MILPVLTDVELAIHASIFFVNIILYLFAVPILRLFNPDLNDRGKVKIFKALNVLVFLLHVVDLIVLRINDQYQGYFIKIGLSLMTLYGTLLCYNAFVFFSRKRFGIKKQIDGKDVYLDSYSTRIVDLILLATFVFTTIYTIVKIWGADSLLETTGIFGISAAFIAFTSSIWGPDVISGLIILNSQMLEDGDVVVVDGYPDEYIISKVTLIYIILYDVRNNHRTLVRNSRFIQSKIDNLSRVASTDGIRQALKFNIGYPGIIRTNARRDEREALLTEFKSKVDSMFEDAYSKCVDNDDIKINNSRRFEWAITNTGDYALEYTLWVYLERIPNTKVTATARKHFMQTIYKINEAVYTASVIDGIELATPMLNEIVESPCNIS